MKYLSAVSKHVSEIFAIIGLALLGYGLFLFEPWVGFSATGFLLFSYGVSIDVFALILNRNGAE